MSGLWEAESNDVKSWHRSASAHCIRMCAGAFAFWALSACEKPASSTVDRTLELNSDTVKIDSNVTLHDVQVRAVQGGDFAPDQLSAKPRDIIRFTLADTRTHGLIINGPTPQATAALQASGQHRSPPLVARQQAWVVSLENLPAGVYNVSCISHAGRLTITIQ